MRKSIFTNTVFYWTIISILSALFLWNLVLVVGYSQFLGLLPIAIQGTILALVVKKHEYARSGIKIWAILFLIVSSSLKLVGGLFGYVAGSVTGNLESYSLSAVSILVGIAIVYYTNKTVRIDIITDEPEASYT
ncbi:hypothetical protein [Rufibacter sp. DG15C]|uniref:hypothetical protein n=1 Tax=Rufibacter sp. DG15C TaxID=1379909 RepID=UPI0012FA0B5C|nr:hypothetical protein [Rufibacter sp. DG15C]